MFYANEYLQLVQDTLQYLSGLKAPILSTKEECDYFRKHFKASKRTAPAPKSCDKNPPICESNANQTLSKTDSPNCSVDKSEKAQMSEANAFSTRQEDNTPIKPLIQKPSLIKEPAAIEKVEELKAEPVRQEMIQPLHFSMGKWKAICKKIAPDLLILADIPSDALAKNIAGRWKTKNLSSPITILYTQEAVDHKALLEQIAIALDVHFAPAKVVNAETLEKEGTWETFLSVESLKLLIVCDYTLWQMPKLLKFYKETNAARYLKEKDLFLLPDLSLYLKDPQLKRSLWKALCQTCAQLLSQSSSTKT